MSVLTIRRLPSILFVSRSIDLSWLTSNCFQSDLPLKAIVGTSDNPISWWTGGGLSGFQTAVTLSVAPISAFESFTLTSRSMRTTQSLIHFIRLQRMRDQLVWFIVDFSRNHQPLANKVARSFFVSSYNSVFCTQKIQFMQFGNKTQTCGRLQCTSTAQDLVASGRIDSGVADVRNELADGWVVHILNDTKSISRKKLLPEVYVTHSPLTDTAWWNILIKK